MRLTDKVDPVTVGVTILVAITLSLAAAVSRSGGNESHKPPPKTPPLTVTQSQSQKASATAHSDNHASTTSNSSSTSDSHDVNTTGSSAQGGSVAFQDRLQAPSVAPPALYASGVCVRGSSFGVAGPGVGIGGGRAYPDPECDIREAARVLDGVGAHALALKVLCTLAAVRSVATPEDCVWHADPVPLIPVAPVAITVLPAPLTIPVVTPVIQKTECDVLARPSTPKHRVPKKPAESCLAPVVKP